VQISGEEFDKFEQLMFTKLGPAENLSSYVLVFCFLYLSKKVRFLNVTMTVKTRRIGMKILHEIFLCIYFF
jgi:hypothetical protein